MGYLILRCTSNLEVSPKIWQKIQDAVGDGIFLVSYSFFYSIEILALRAVEKLVPSNKI